jgi:RNA polymerase sigma-70 factor (ECF subfamily)
MHLSDLYLACGCANGDPAAVEAFETSCLRPVRAPLARRGFAAAVIDEVQQVTRVRLLVAEEQPRIVAYSGSGSLGAWVRVVALREALAIVDDGKRAAGDAQLFDSVPDPAEDPELALLQSKYSAQFKDAFQQAIAGLSVRERSLFRLQVIDGLSGEEIGRIYGAHKATVNRWLAKARRALLADTRKILQRALGVEPFEIESILRLVDSQLELSLQRVLRSE